jgi:hypothetical protein
MTVTSITPHPGQGKGIAAAAFPEASTARLRFIGKILIGGIL